jgi:putative ABC transport system permease protein
MTTWRSLFGRTTDTSVYVVRKPGAALDDVEASIRSSVAGWAGIKVQSHAELRAYYASDAQNVTSMFDAMLAPSVIISIFGVVNTLALSVLERTREIGLLRAVGGSRRQVRRMVRYEGVLTTLIGATLGLALGVLLAGLTDRSDRGRQVQHPVRPARRHVRRGLRARRDRRGRPGAARDATERGRRPDVRVITGAGAGAYPSPHVTCA